MKKVKRFQIDKALRNQMDLASKERGYYGYSDFPIVDTFNDNWVVAEFRREDLAEEYCKLKNSMTIG